jgi:hypothetical protein
MRSLQRNEADLSSWRAQTGVNSAGLPNAVPYFVPTLNQKPYQSMVFGLGSKSPVLALKINTIGNHRTP